ncbi:hypothetical protein XIS1_1260017 [Xenorhabdus innexi]|uniref:Uncharacterized protein n=1 Tax=Xenorhabdus innexi TaxID=290109 RepID=A0A1N6MSE8_9GAMM|nr:hypothetical protein XIS1_1260017 [Xenorhabdus innexi]
MEKISGTQLVVMTLLQSVKNSLYENTLLITIKLLACRIGHK